MYFFTVVTYGRRILFEDPSARRLLGNALRAVCRERPFDVFAIVLLWDHLHSIWSLPAGDADFSQRWKRIKDHFTEAWLRADGAEMPVTPSQKDRGHRGIWQRRFWEHLLRDDDDLERHCDYIHYNPVKHGYVAQPRDWPWSSFHRFVARGIYPLDWGGDPSLDLVVE
jgi:putative transposase